jgi:basic amino acid/polyamine antiporter, APA family
VTAEARESYVPSRLRRRLGTSDAVIIGLGAMIGAGVFAAIGPAAEAAGGGLIIGLFIAGFVAYCNATSSAQLAAVYPQSGGTYVYGRERLGHFWGYIAGWCFVVGKVASCAAVALTFGFYLDPSVARVLAVTVVVALTTINYFGVEKAAWVTKAIVAVVLASLTLVVAAALLGGEADAGRLTPLVDGQGTFGILQAGGLLFFAFAGYARIATLGEEVRDPERTIPKAIPLALGITVLVYGAVAVSALMAVGPDVLAEAEAPLADAVRAGRLDELLPAVRIGAVVATTGVLLSLLAGVSRTVFAMSSQRDLPGWLAAVHPRHHVPHRAELVIGVTVAVIAASVDLRHAIGFSSFGVLLYYGIANASALTLPAEQRRWPRPIAAAGVLGCLVLAFTLPTASVIAGAAVVLVGVAVFLGRALVVRQTDKRR